MAPARVSNSRTTPYSRQEYRIPKIQNSTYSRPPPARRSQWDRPQYMQFPRHSRPDPTRSYVPTKNNFHSRRQEFSWNEGRSPSRVEQTTYELVPVGKSFAVEDKKVQKIDMFVDSKFVVSLSLEEAEQTIHVDDKPVVIRYFPCLDRLRIGNHSFPVSFDGSIYAVNFFNMLRTVSFQKC